MTVPRKRLLTGDRTTGKLHLGHYVGSLKNRLRFQESGEYDCYFLLADLHTLTTKPDKDSVRNIRENAREIVLDWMAVGLDPAKSTFVQQSRVPAVYELNLYFEMLVSLPRVARLPSIKDMARNANLDEESMPLGLVGYPVLQAADILLPKADIVPVGRDNEAYVEITREIARRFNFLYGGAVFPEPQAIVPSDKLLPGTDGNPKMSKSRNNCIFLSDDAKTVEQKVRGMYTDPNRTRPDIPGNVEGNPVFALHEAFNPNGEEVEDLTARYRAGAVGDVEVKKKLIVALNAFLDPIRQRREELARNPNTIDDIIATNTRRYNEQVAEVTLGQVREAMGLFGPGG